MALKLMGAIAGLALAAVGLVACEKYDYDPSQPRNWEKFYALPGAPTSTKIDTLSIKSIEDGMQFDIGDDQGFDTITFNCETGARVTTKRVVLNEKGKVIEYSDSPDLDSSIPTSIAPAYAALCKQVGVEPIFLSLLIP